MVKSQGFIFEQCSEIEKSFARELSQILEDSSPELCSQMMLSIPNSENNSIDLSHVEIIVRGPGLDTWNNQILNLARKYGVGKYTIDIYERGIRKIGEWERTARTPGARGLTGGDRILPRD